MKTFDVQLEAIAVALCRGRPVVLDRVSVGAHTPAVRPEGCPAFVVLNLAGTPLTLAHDAYEAAVQALQLNADDFSARDLRAMHLNCPAIRPPDCHLAALERLDRAGRGSCFSSDVWLRERRGFPSDWRWTHALAKELPAPGRSSATNEMVTTA